MSKVIRYFSNLRPRSQEDMGRRHNSSTSGQFLSKLAIRNVPQHDWSRTISEAEKLVRYEGSFRSLRQLLSDEMAVAGLNLQDRINSEHPLFKTAKNLSYIDEKVLAWGLIVQLVSKATGHDGVNISNQNQDTSAGVLQSQRTLAEVTDMVRKSQLLHQAIINLKSSNNFGNDLSGDSDLVSGNKIALLGGDSLLAKAFKQTASLRNHDLNQLISSALRDLTESNFIGDRDDQNNPLPSKPQPNAEDSSRDVNNLNTLNFGDLDDNIAPLKTDGFIGSAEKEWSLRNVLGGGSLLGKGCQGALMLGGHPEPLQRLGYLFGRHLALAWQACLDRQPFQQSNLRQGTQFSLVSAPVLFHLEHDATLYEEIEKGCKSVDNIDYSKVHQIVSQGPGVKMTKVLQLKHSVLVTRILHELPLTDAKTSLENIVLAMQEL